MLETVLPRLLGYVPISWRRAVIGNASDPSVIATIFHNLLNRLPPGQAHVFECHGPLEGCRMCVAWDRFRSFVYGTWEPEVTSAITSTVRRGMRIADIGAHVGYYTLLLAKCAGPTGRVVSFEPSVDNFASLKKNVQLNKLPNIHLFQEAVYSRTGSIILNVPEDAQKSGDASVRHMARSRSLQVKATTLDSFCESLRFRPDFIKIDVEGAEHDVLMGGQQIIAQSCPKMLIELHHFEGNVDAHPVPDLLAQWGYDVKWIDRWNLTSHILALPRLVASEGVLR